MAKIIPFRGFLPPLKLAKEISSEPYDVLSSDEARKIVLKNKKSFLRIIKAEVDFPISKIPKNKSIHNKAAENLNKFIQKGFLIEDDKECFYIYKISKGGHSQTGLIAAVSIKEYDNQKIKKHEFTRPEKEDDRTLHINTTKANTGPVFLVFKNDGNFQNQFSKYSQRPSDIYFEASDGSIHSLIKIQDKTNIDSIKRYFQSIDNLYIADGHHRAASASRVHKNHIKANQNYDCNTAYNYFLATIFPHDEVQILGYNRLVKDLNGLNKERFFIKIKNDFILKKSSKKIIPYSKGVFSMYFDKEWFTLKLRENIIADDPVLGLDASILQNYILKPILGIHDPRINSRIDFVGGSRGLGELEKRCTLDAKVAFALYPVTINDLMRVADEDKVMPPKSTWFEPKLRSGLVVRKFD